MTDVISCVNFKEDMSWGYIEGYKRAAHLLRDSLLVEQRDLDLLIYPLGYLYRHHIELHLKRLIATVKQFRDVESTVPFTHSLTSLWQQLKHELSELASQITFPDGMEEWLDELVSLDNSAENFRFDKTRDGTNTLANVRHINVSDFCSHMDAIVEHLDALHCWLSESIDWHREVKASSGQAS